MQDGVPIVQDDVRHLAPGDLFAGCHIESRIGRGGMGLVYKARQALPERVVAVKVIVPELAGDSGYRARFKQEASLAAQIEHPNVIPIYGVGEQDGLLYIIMRFVEGLDLDDLLRSRHRFAPGHAARFLAQIAAALDVAHTSGLVHRDVKPANVLVSGVAPEEHLYLTDFGLTKRIEGSMVTPTSPFVGTLDYIAPEQLKGDPVDRRGDVYALGCVCFQLLTGVVPFPRDNDAAKIYAHVEVPAPRLTSVVPTLPAALDAVVAKAMAKDPALRFSSAGALARAATAAATRHDRAEIPNPSKKKARRTAAAGIVGSEGRSTVLSRNSPVRARRRAARQLVVGKGVGHEELASAQPRPVTDGPDPASGIEQHRSLLPERVVATGWPRSHLGGTAPAGTSLGPRRRRGRVALIGTVLLVTATVTGLFFLTLGGRPTLSSPEIVRTGPLTISYHSPWHAAARVPPASFVLASSSSSPPSGPISLSSGDTTVAAGVLAQSATVPGGVPPQLKNRWGTPLALGTARVANNPGRRYEWRITGGRRLVAFVLPSVSSDLAILCSAGSSDETAIRSCAVLASAATASGSQLLPPGPDARLVAALAGGLERVAAARHQFVGLDSDQLQSRTSSARRIARLERSALRALADLRPIPRYRPVLEALEAALSAEAASFTGFAGAALANDRRAYATVRLQLIAAGQHLADATASLVSRGVPAPPLAALKLARLTSSTAPPPSRASGTSAALRAPRGPRSPPPDAPAGPPAQKALPVQKAPTGSGRIGSPSVVLAQPLYSQP